MKYRKIMFMLVLAIFIFGAASVCASDVNETTIASEDTIPIEIAQSDEISVNDDNQAIGQANDEEIISEGNVGTFSQLQENINTTSNGTLELDRNYEYNNGFNSSGIIIDKKITIDGKGYTIDAKGKARVFNIQAGDVTIKNLTIINAKTNGDGGAIYMLHYGTVENCNFINNEAYADGGAIYFMRHGNVANCNFTDNQVGHDGGAINFAITGTVTNCNFDNNRRHSDSNFVYTKGGAISMYASGTVENCNFTNNFAKKGGAIHFAEYTICDVTNCNFVNNSADSGGAIWMYDGTVENCNFVKNFADMGGAIYYYHEGNVTNCKFTYNQATGDTGDGGAIYFFTGYAHNVTDCNFTNNWATEGGAICSQGLVKVENCNFDENIASGWGGALCSKLDSDVINCNFINNWANEGGAIWEYGGTVKNCNFNQNIAHKGGAIRKFDGTVETCKFTSNTADDCGGAVSLRGNCVVTNCNFNSNTGKDGGAVYFYDKGNVINCNFARNSASQGGAIFSYDWYAVTADTCIFKTGSDTTFNTHNVTPILNVDDFTTVYGSGEKLTFDLKTNSSIPVPTGNILISVYFKGNNSWVGNYSCLSGEGWIPDLPVGSYIAVFNTEYDKFQPINRTITVNKIQTQVVGNAVTATYKVNKYLVITLKDDKGNPISDAKLTVDLGGVKTYTTDKNGQIKISTKALAAKTYNAKITFNGGDIYDKSSNVIKVTVKKATPKMTAKKKTFKRTVKTKKYTIVLKDNNGKAMKKVKVTLKIKGKKTITVKTNSKGKATFKIKKLTKKGTYKSTVTFKGNKYYNKVVKKVKIKIK